MAGYKAKPQPMRQLQRQNETLSSFESWRGHLIYTLSLDPNFAPFASDGFKWEKISVENRGLPGVRSEDAKSFVTTPTQQANFLKICLGMIAGYAPVISRTTIVNNCCSLKEIFQKLRAHYGFSVTGSSIIDVVSISKKNDETPEDTFQRIQSLVDSCLLTAEDDLEHHGEDVEEDEIMSPTLENLVTCLWLKAIHPSLPQLVKLKYGTHLKNCTLASIREEISCSIPELLSELNDRETSAQIQQASSYNSNNRFRQNGPSNFRPRFNNNNRFQRPPSNNGRGQQWKPQGECPLCQQAGRRNFQHKLYSCPYLPNDYKKFVDKVRLIECLEEDQQGYQGQPQDYDNDFQYNQYGANDYSVPTEELEAMTFDSQGSHNQNQVGRVSTSPSPWFFAHLNNRPVKITIDTGATVNLVNEQLLRSLNINFYPPSQSAHQADGLDNNQLQIVGEVRFTMTWKNYTLHFEGLVSRHLGSEILAGMPFMKSNAILVDPMEDALYIRGEKHVYLPQNALGNKASISRVVSAAICPSSTTLFPSDYVDVVCSNNLPDTQVLLQPSEENKWIKDNVTYSINGKIRVVNDSPLPVKIDQNQILGSVYQINDNQPEIQHLDIAKPPPKDQGENNFLKIEFNPQSLDIDPNWENKFKDLHKKYSSVFDNNLPGYNGKFGAISAYVNVGDSLPPQRKGRIPQYSRGLLSELQNQFDTLETMGVFAKPESVGTYAEYANPSFLVKKPDGSYRLVTSFGEVAAHNKPTPTVTPTMDTTLRNFGGWKYIIKSDLKKAYFQIPLHPDSRKFCAVVTPFKGVRVYCRAAMGMPGSEAALDELMSRILGDLVQSGHVQRVADDIYIGADNLDTLFRIWEIVLNRLKGAGLRLSAPKTVIIPITTTVLGWIWTNRKLSASEHHTAALSKCDMPKTVKSLRSYIGAYKVISRVLPHCSQYLAPLDDLTAGKQSADLVSWSPETLTAFKKSQEHLLNCVPITIPSQEDKLWLITDACTSNLGIGATLLTTNIDGSNQQLASLFSAKLKKGHQHWLPCELECLGIATSINHFRPFILDSNHKTTVLTDSKPAVQAYQRFMRGEFSTSSRLQAFLLASTQNNVTLSHIQGSDNLLSDFQSRNSVICNHPSCSVCKFIDSSEHVSVNSISVSDIVKGNSRVPFSSNAAWLQIQLNCPVTQLARKHLQQGTRPMKKQKNVREVKQLLRVCSVTKEGMLVVNKESPLKPSTELIVIPQNYISGLLTALHLQLGHPTAHQLQQVFSRQFYAINSDKLIQYNTDQCHPCFSLKKLSIPPVPSSTTAPYTHIGSNFAADIIRKCSQKILVLCEEVTKFTQATIIDSEDHTAVISGLKLLLLPLHPPCSPTATLKLDPGPGMQTIRRLQSLQDINIIVELGEPKNINKMATIDKVIQELENELVRVTKGHDSNISKVDLSLAVSVLNSRIRATGMSSFEQWHKRSQFDKKQLHFSDELLIDTQASQRHSINNSRNMPPSTESFKVGTIVYLVNEKSKHSARPRYIVDRIDGVWLYLRKLTESQIRSKLYKVHKNSCMQMKEPQVVRPPNQNDIDFDSDSDGDDTGLENSEQPVRDNLDLAENTAPPTESHEVELRRSTRERHSPPRLKDYVRH